MNKTHEVEKMKVVACPKNHGPAELPQEGTWKQVREIKDIREGKALVLCTNDDIPKPVVRVIFPKFKGWEKNPKLANYRELTLEEIFK